MFMKNKEPSQISNAAEDTLTLCVFEVTRDLRCNSLSPLEI